MISVPRATVRRFRTLLKRARIGKSNVSAQNSVIFRTAADGFHIHARSTDVAIEYHEPGQFESVQELGVPIELLANCESSGQDLLSLEAPDSSKIVASWADHGIPQLVEYPAAWEASATCLPQLPESFEQNPAALRAALQTAGTVACQESSRYALNCLQLRGSQGNIAATDGRQVLIQSGFQFPWSDEILVPSSSVFGCRELVAEQDIGVGLVEDWLALRIGPWTIWLRVEREARFPKLDDLIRNPSAAPSKLTLSEADATFLADKLARLPGDDATNHPVTVDLNGQVIVRSRSEAQPRATELVLAGSRLSGEPIAINTNREFLAQAIKLGFREFYLFSANSPAQCDDGRRQYLWALLEPDSVIRAGEDAIRIESTTNGNPASTTPPKSPKRRFRVGQPTSSAASSRTTRLPRVSANKPAVEPQNGSTIGHAMALRGMLRETLSQTNELVRAIKRDKRQNRLVALTLASLKQLQKVAG